MTQANTNNAYGKDIAMTVIGAGSYGTSLAISLAQWCERCPLGTRA